VGENLDAMTEWELRQWAEENRGRVSRELLDYAGLKAEALEARARGRSRWPWPWRASATASTAACPGGSAGRRLSG
jgi:hypothetical protein